MGQTAVILAYQSFIASRGSKQSQVQSFGWFAAVVSIAQSLGPALTGFAADLSDLTTVFYFAAALAAVSFVVLPFNRDNGSTVAIPTLTDVVATSWWHNKMLVFAVSTTLMSSLAFSIRTSFLPLFLADNGATTTQIGVLFSAQAIAALAVRSQLGRLSRWFGDNMVIAGALLITAPALLAIPWAKSYEIWMISAVVIGMAYGMVNPLTMALAAAAVSIQDRGMSLGIRYTAMRLGNTVGPFLLGMATSLGGLPITFVVASLLCIGGGIMSFVKLQEQKLGQNEQPT